MMNKLNTMLFSSVTIIMAVLCGCAAQHQSNPYNLSIIQTNEDYQQEIIKNPDMRMVDIEREIEGIKLDIRYATKYNFTGQKIYSAPRAFVRQPVASALKKVQDSLLVYHCGLKIYDAYRPYSATVRFYEVYPDTAFVANPRYGSRHNRGLAVDVTLTGISTDRELPMPSAYDDFSVRAHPDFQELSDTVLKNRKLLFDIMEHFGFMHYPTEWWHFDYKGWEQAGLMDLSFAELDKALWCKKD